MPGRAIGRVYGHFGRGQLEDEPAAARVDAGEAEDVTDESTIRLGILAVEDDMRPADHGWPLSIDVLTMVSTASWHARVEKIFGWDR
ncbi:MULTISPECIES: hypothetical protein [unclassified Streptomyces]|uniref:hypothetical protein n=1 Tax=unclassified Streptomyces TaxID=2593676 RepID=UPI00332C9B38